MKRVLKNRWIPHTPTPKQMYFLLLDCREAFFGGAAGGGKSDALLAGAVTVDPGDTATVQYTLRTNVAV